MSGGADVEALEVKSGRSGRRGVRSDKRMTRTERRLMRSAGGAGKSGMRWRLSDPNEKKALRGLKGRGLRALWRPFLY